ncbi:hypothetical protein B0P06_004260 [Clostridium saccharoperbutylacetonicum]|uniref:Uncharacterized protein n=2 Tax=Clostridium saccharoperbutylacetonicum TaxID=36745 RepID=M1MRR2_9CLOT|nr:hypothetical protein [Clostridium saccharoperbutylacetonicum]AGF57441.1 hypothetical protein Cspa_c36810 [Clostridium saccharoperbutylacetonicum N1-4(HMT)]NRT61793.1 hypothetical protein [Clostridium saccharoperbutylacetonicum]NSB44489.1 hypothetical protein [Clostridium saccharoperbutylacetonicum]
MNIKGLTKKNIVEFINTYYMHIFLVAYSFFGVWYLISLWFPSIGDGMFIPVLFSLITLITHFCELQSIFQTKLKKDIFIDKYYEYKPENISENNFVLEDKQKIEIYKIMFEEDKKEKSDKVSKNQKKKGINKINFFFIMFAHIIILACYSKWAVMNTSNKGLTDNAKNVTDVLSYFCNAYTYSIFLLFFVQVIYENDFKRLYLDKVFKKHILFGKSRKK